ncbi:glycosyltransferase family 2 protein [Candidatus Uhrbacteria bacterium]|nr:glycosyltransferase family 2 protein [Candidatus Uhrbacteria bacterium]
MDRIDISIIIVNYRARGLVRECIKGIKQLHTKLRLEIIVVDNSPHEGVGEMLAERFSNVHYLPQDRNIGFAAGNNAGIRIAQGKYIMLLNYDITPLPGSFDYLHAYLENNPAVGMVGPQLINPNGTIQHSYYRFHSFLTPVYRRLWIGRFGFGKRHLDRFLMADMDTTSPVDVDWLLGACLMVRASSIKTVGMMDERFFLYFEDTDWCRRFWKAKLPVRYVPGARMVHLHRRESAKGGGILSLTHKTTRIHVISWLKYILKWHMYGRRAS